MSEKIMAVEMILSGQSEHGGHIVKVMTDEGKYQVQGDFKSAVFFGDVFRGLMVEQEDKDGNCD